MQENHQTTFTWSNICPRIREKKVFLCWFIPIIFICTWILTYSVPSYYISTTSLSTEGVQATDGSRTITLNRPENYDLGLATTVYSIVPDDYCEVIYSTDFLCRVLNTPIVNADSSFIGTYYEYIATQYQYSWYTNFIRFIHRKKQPAMGDPLPVLDPFHPRGLAIEAINTAKKNIRFDINPRSKLITLTVKEQDPLVAALIAQAVSDGLNQFATDYYLSKTKQTYQHMQTMIAQANADYEQAMQNGDNTYAAMLRDARLAFERQAITINAQARSYQMFTTLNNVSVPTGIAGPRHLSLAIPVTLFILMLVLMCICRRELVDLMTQSPSQE